MAAASGVIFLLILVASIVGQFVLGHHLNKTRKQSSVWWLWVLFLGWIGVIIIACQSPKSDDNEKIVYVYRDAPKEYQGRVH